MLKDEIVPFIDKYGLVTPGPSNGTTGNGTMYTGEYFIIKNVLENAQFKESDSGAFHDILFKCMRDGLTLRSPEDTSLDSPDNMLGIIAACSALDTPLSHAIAASIYSYGKKHFGFYDPTGTNGFSALLFRQLQLVFSMVCASGAYSLYNPLHWLLNAYTALIIGTSCMFATPNSGADSWRLNWLLIKATSPYSFLCRMAAKLWQRRLLKMYPNGMFDVYQQYYNPKGIHPFTKYMVKY